VREGEAELIESPSRAERQQRRSTDLKEKIARESDWRGEEVSGGGDEASQSTTELRVVVVALQRPWTGLL
jgi:hypothetical protein